MIRRVASMMTTLRPYLLESESEIGSYTSEADSYNIGDERVIELADAFIEATGHDYPIAKFY